MNTKQILSSLEWRLRQAASGDEYTRKQLRKSMVAWAASMLLNEKEAEELVDAAGYAFHENGMGAIVLQDKEAA